MSDTANVREVLEAHSDGEGHRGFRTQDGTYYEGYFLVDEDEDIIHFTSGGPFGGWDKDFAFNDIDMNSLLPPVVFLPDGSPVPGE